MPSSSISDSKPLADREDLSQTQITGMAERGNGASSTPVFSSSGDEVANTSLHSDSEKTVIRNRSSDSDLDRSPPKFVPKHGWQSSAETLLGSQLDHFRIDSLVGMGGMGAVFRGEDIRLHREVAIKAIPTAGRDPEAMRRFRFEAQSAAKLDHPNIARVYYVGETPDWSYIVFEFVEGVNLRELVVRQGPMSVDQSVYLIRQVAQALQHASERQVVHRDIKPSNIVLTPQGQAKIVDMGLARATELDRSTNDLTASGVTLGTFDYISPEQAHDPRDADVRSDIYSLGCTWYFLLTGVPPFPDGTALQKLLMHGTKMPEDPRVHRTDLSDSLIAILRKMIAKKPGDRYQQPMDLIDDLQTLAILENLAWTRDTDPRDSVGTKHTSWVLKSIPYLVAFSAVIAIAVWLQSDGMRSAQFTIPRVSYPDVRVVEAQSGTSARQPETVPIVLSVPAEPGSVIVDSRFNQETLEANRQLAVSLDQAIERVNLTPEANRIVLQSPTLISTSTLKNLSRNQESLAIQSKEGMRCFIDIDFSDKELLDNRGWMDCGSAQITFTNCDIRWQSDDVRQALFVCRPGCRLTFFNCTLTIEMAQTSSSLQSFSSAIRCESNSNSIAESGTGVPSTQIVLNNSVVRGNADVLQAAAPVRCEARIENSLIAVSGSMLTLPKINSLSQSGSRIIFDLQSVTSWTHRSWIYANWVAGDSKPIPVTRTARESVFGGMESLIVWEVAANENWKFWEQAEQGKSLERWLDLRGRDNSYDEPVTRQLVEARLRNGMSEQLPLSADANLISEERGTELSIPWKRRPTNEEATSNRFPISQFALQESSFSRGALLEKLPKAPKGNLPNAESDNPPTRSTAMPLSYPMPM